MTTYTWPSASDSAFLPSTMEPIVSANNRASVSPLSGYVQTTGMPGSKWGWALGFGPQAYSERQRVEAFLAGLNGMEHRAAIYDMGRPLPLGTINTSGVTASAASQFATTLVLNGCGNTKTLKAGDWFSVVTAAGVQLLMNLADATSNAGGVMTVTEFRHKLRGAVSGGAAVVLDKPTGIFVLTSNITRGARNPGLQAAPFTVEFMEAFA